MEKRNIQLSELIKNTQKLNQFAKKGIFTVSDLQSFFPRKYLDYSQITHLNNKSKEQVVEGAFEIVAHSITDGKSKNGMPYLCLSGVDAVSGAKITVYWFQQTMKRNYICDIVPGDHYFAAGKAEYSFKYRNYTIMAPAFFFPFSEDCKRIYPVYSKIPNMSDSYLEMAINMALGYSIEEPYPVELANHFGMPSFQDSVMELHRPTSQTNIDAALKRQKFDVLLKFALQLKNVRRKANVYSPYIVHSTAMLEKIIKELPYHLTDDQEGIIMGIVNDMRSGKCVNALIQGDVGCGKSIVAFLLMFVLAENGYQCVLMAPSKVLAQQHYRDIEEFARKLGIKTVLYCSDGMKRSEQKTILNGIKDGSTQIVVGTHALLSEKIEFSNLALTITDEEHKFGVLQRDSLNDKARQGVHIITMSATPIPRSLAKVIYGDEITLYTIHTMPAGRSPVKTSVVSNQKQALQIVEEQLELGHQAFVVCPMIDTTEKTENIASVKDIVHSYMEYFSSAGKYASIAVLTGKTSKSDMQNILDDFSQGKTDILVATTVVEVGINIPNATAIVIQNAERFGLSALHQLRGRVGRSKFESFCVLVSPEQENERLKIMEKTNSGFEVAREDLRIRGAGEWLGNEQSGKNSLAVQLMIAYPKVFDVAKDVAEKMLKNHVEWKIVKDALSELKD